MASDVIRLILARHDGLTCCTLTAMPDAPQPGSPANGDDPVIEAENPTSEAGSEKAATATRGDAGSGSSSRPVFSVYGWVSVLLGLVAVAAVVAGSIAWSLHRSDVDERGYRGRVLQSAASWTSVLINLNAENVEKGMERLHNKTAGQLHSEFDSVVQPYRDVVQRIQSRSTGRIEAVAIESLQKDPGPESGAENTAKQAPPPGARRTDPVVVIATSIAENVGGKPQTVHWALQLDVSDIDGQMLISGLRSIR